VCLAAALVTSCSSGTSSSTPPPSAPAASPFCGRVSQALNAESTLVGIAPSDGLEHLGVSDSALITLQADARSLASNLQQASEQAPTTSLKKALSDLALQVSTTVTFANPVSTLQLQAQDAASGLTPLYRSLGQLCPSAISHEAPTSRQQAELAAKSLVEDAAVVASGRGQALTQADVTQLLALAGQRAVDSVTVTKPLGAVAHHPDAMAFKVTNLGGTWPVCVQATPTGAHAANHVTVITCPSGTAGQPMMK
jgi:hypothetical protein